MLNCKSDKKKMKKFITIHFFLMMIKKCIIQIFKINTPTKEPVSGLRCN